MKRSHWRRFKCWVGWHKWLYMLTPNKLVWFCPHCGAQQ